MLDGEGLSDRAAERASEAFELAPRLDGGPTHPDLFSQIFDRHIAKSTLPRIRLHDLRHTHASILQVSDVAEEASFDMVRDRCAIREKDFSSIAAAG
ncbi:MAG TPA: hypothetical protein VM142_14230 [Acidimicrobiales bacterium]|nr:hypothetical protein [Acidimicrobiales bacterium]